MNNEQAETIKATASKSIAEIPVFRLARLADCGEPDSAETAGAKLLVSVRDSVEELVNGLETSEVTEIATDPDDIGWLDDSGAVHEIADGAPDVYTHTRWAEFVDLAAYDEDPSEVGGTTDDLTGAAGIALYMIAERLVWALLNDAAATIAESAAELDEDEEDDN